MRISASVRFSPTHPLKPSRKSPSFISSATSAQHSELGKVQASRIEVIDRYVCYVQLGADTGDAAEKGDEEVLAVCQQENERAIDIIEKTILNVS